MANTSISGLVSGLDTATIISQLMQLEAQPQTNLKSRVSTEQNQVASLQTVNAKLAAIATASTDLAKSASWSPVTATSDNAHVTVTAASTAVPTSLTISIGQVATASTATYSSALTLNDTSQAKINATLTIGGNAISFSTGDGKLQTIADALNATGKVKATLVRAGMNGSDPTYQLHVDSVDTGSNSGFTITDASGNAFLGGPAGGAVVTGKDATITVGGQTLTSSSNTITGLMPGVDVTLAAGAENTSATITVGRDTASLSTKVKAMVDAVNAALTDIDSVTAYDPSTKTAGLLSGDAGLRSVRDQLLSAVTTGVGGKSLADVGIQTDKNGRLVFDATKFASAYDADPTGTAARFTGNLTYAGSGTVSLQGSTWRTVAGSYAVDEPAGTINGSTASRAGNILTGASGTPVDGLSLNVSTGATGTVTYSQGIAATFEALAQRASDATTGTVSAAIKGRNSDIKNLNDDIADWDVRLSAKQAALQSQYAALEVALGKMQDQASWLNGQIASLPKSG